jgi:hypothetical protein
MEFIPRLMVSAGLAMTREVQAGGQVDEAKLLSIYTRLRESGFSYGSFQLDPAGTGAVIQAQPAGETVTLRPPLVQVQSVLRDGTVELGARKAGTILAIAADVLGVAELQQLGVRVIYNAPLPTNDAKAFTLNQLMSVGTDHVGDLTLGGEVWGGVKYVVGHADGQYTILIEPAVADAMRSLYIDIDAQFPGAHSPNSILEKASQVKGYANGRLGAYLDKIAGT